MPTKLKKMRKKVAKKYGGPSEATAKKVGSSAEKSANKKGLTGEQKDAYVYGTKRKTGWKPKSER